MGFPVTERVGRTPSVAGERCAPEVRFLRQLRFPGTGDQNSVRCARPGAMRFRARPTSAITSRHPRKAPPLGLSFAVRESVLRRTWPVQDAPSSSLANARTVFTARYERPDRSSVPWIDTSWLPMEGTAMSKERSTIPEWLTTADTVSVLDAPHRESPTVIDTARAPFALGLLLVPALIIIAGIVGMVRTAVNMLRLPW